MYSKFSHSNKEEDPPFSACMDLAIKNVKTQLKIILESYSGIEVSFPHTRAGRKAIVTYNIFHLKDQVVYIHTYITLLFYKIEP